MSTSRTGQRARNKPGLMDMGTGRKVDLEEPIAQSNRRKKLELELFGASPDYGESVLLDVDELTLLALSRLKPLEKKFLFLRLGLGSSKPLSLIAAAQLMSLEPDDAHDLESQALANLEQIAGQKTALRIGKALPASTDQETKTENELRAALELRELRRRENARSTPIHSPDQKTTHYGVVPDETELMTALGQLPALWGGILRKRLGIDLPQPATSLEVAKSLGLKTAATVDFLCVQALKALGPHLSQPKITGLGIMLFEDQDTTEERELAESQARAQSRERDRPPETTQDPEGEPGHEDAADQENQDDQDAGEPPPVPESEDEDMSSENPEARDKDNETVCQASATEAGAEKPDPEPDQRPARPKKDKAIPAEWQNDPVVSGLPKNLAKRLLRVMAGLPPVPSEVLRQRLGIGQAEALSIPQIADALHKGRQAVYSAYSLARKRLKDELGEKRLAELERRMPYRQTNYEDQESPAQDVTEDASASDGSRIEAAIRDLPELLRKAVELRLLPLTIGEVAKGLGISYNAASIRCQKAFSQLRRRLPHKLFKQIQAKQVRAKRIARHPLPPTVRAANAKAVTPSPAPVAQAPVQPTPPAQPALPVPAMPAPTAMPTDLTEVRLIVQAPKGVMDGIVSLIGLATAKLLNPQLAQVQLTPAQPPDASLTEPTEPHLARGRSARRVASATAGKPPQRTASKARSG